LSPVCEIDEAAPYVGVEPAGFKRVLHVVFGFNERGPRDRQVVRELTMRAAAEAFRDVRRRRARRPTDIRAEIAILADSCCVSYDVDFLLQLIRQLPSGEFLEMCSAHARRTCTPHAV